MSVWELYGFGSGKILQICFSHAPRHTLGRSGTSSWTCTSRALVCASGVQARPGVQLRATDIMSNGICATAVESTRARTHCAHGGRVQPPARTQTCLTCLTPTLTRCRCWRGFAFKRLQRLTHRSPGRPCARHLAAAAASAAPAGAARMSRPAAAVWAPAAATVAAPRWLAYAYPSG